MTTFKTLSQGSFLENDRFRLEEKLGEGGMAVVYRARDLSRDAEVVVKIPKQGVFDESALGRFAKESQALVKLSHPHIVRIWHVGDHEGWPFIVLDYLTGGDLEACRQAFGGRLSLLNITKWAPAIASALDYIHAYGYVHRDIKPSNILFDGQGNALLSDFGIAKAVQNPQATRLTGTGQLLGTPAYMAPELIMGRAIDGRADQYGLATAIYECLSGEPPFSDATTGAVLVKHVSEVPPPLDQIHSDIPSGVANVIAKALAKDPEERFASCSEMVAHLIVNSQATHEAHFPVSQAGPPPVPAQKTTMRPRQSGTQPHLSKAPIEPASHSTASSHPRTVPSPKGKRRPPPLPPRNSTIASSPSRVVPPSNGRSRKWGAWIGVGAVSAALVIVLAAWMLQRPDESSTTAESGENDIANQDAQLAAQVHLKPSQGYQLDEGKPWSVTLSAAEGESPPASVSYHLEQPPPKGLELDEVTGVLSWRPEETQGPGKYPLVLIARHQTGNIMGRESYALEVREQNDPPVFAAASPVQVNPQTGLRLPLSARDSDWPANELTYSFQGAAPVGLVLNPKTGVLTCDRTSAAALAGVQKVVVRVSDNGIPPRFADQEIPLDFSRIEVAPVLKQTLSERRTLKLPIRATIPGDEQSAFTYRLVGPVPPGSQLNAQTGEFEWTAPPQSAGAMHTVTVEVASVAKPSLQSRVQFQIEVESLTPTAYWDLPPLPDLKSDPEAVVLLKDPAFAQKSVALKLLGFDTFSDRVSSRQPGSAELEAIYHTQAGVLDKDLPKEQPLGRFAVKDGELVFQWNEFRDSEMRKYQHILREAVLQVQVPGSPHRYYALKTPKVLSPLELQSVLTEPYDEKRIGERWDPLPASTSRNLIFQDVRLELASVSQTEPDLSDIPSNLKSYPEVAGLLGLESFQLAFEEKPDELVWSVQTQPSVREAYDVLDGLKGQLFSASKSLANARNKLAANSALLNNAEAQIANGKKGWEQRRAQYSRAVATGGRDVARYSSQVADLTPKHAAASQAYAVLKGPLDRAHSGKITFSVSRMVEGVKLQVLTVGP